MSFKAGDRVRIKDYDKTDPEEEFKYDGRTGTVTGGLYQFLYVSLDDDPEPNLDHFLAFEEELELIGE